MSTAIPEQDANMGETSEPLLEGIFGVSKPAHLTTPQVILDLQRIFASSTMFAPLLQSTRAKMKPEQKIDPDRAFKMGHGGTLDPLASGILVVGIGRGTKSLSRYLIEGTKTYETVVLFGASTDTYDVEGLVTDRAEHEHLTADLVNSYLPAFRGTILQAPPLYSSIMIDGMKAHEYARAGKELPRGLAPREVTVDEATLLEWMPAGTHSFAWPGDDKPAPTPAARFRIMVSSGFYVRSFVHDLAIACGSLGTMAVLHRSQQGGFTTTSPPEQADWQSTIPIVDFEAGENVWGPKIREQLVKWMEKNPAKSGGHVNGRAPDVRERLRAERANAPRQRFRGEWEAVEKKDRIKQQGGKMKGKYKRKRKEPVAGEVAQGDASEAVS